DREIAGRHYQRISVARGGGGDHHGAAHAACPAHVFHKEVLAERLGEHLRDQAGDEVGRPTGWIGHDDAYRPDRIVGAASGARVGKQRDTREEGNKISPSHCKTGHSITSSARASSVVGTSRPSALATLRLTINSYLV